MNRGTVVWFALAGVLAVARWLLDFASIQYYDPETFLDYGGVLLQTAAGLATGAALVLFWRDPPVRRGSFLVAISGLAAVAQGTGSLFEDGFGWEWGVWGFFLGGVSMVFSLATAGILALTVSSPWRWSGLYLLIGASGGMLGLGLLMMGLTWLALSVWINRRITGTHTPQFTGPSATHS